MASQQIPGTGLWLPRHGDLFNLNPAFTSMVVDATGEMAAYCGRVWFLERTGSKTINKIHIRPGALTSAGGSIIRFSLQDISLTTGPVMRPDETQDQFRDHAISAMTANTWFSTGLVTSDGTDTGTKRTVNFNELLGVNMEFDAGGRLGADSFTASGIVTGSTGFFAAWQQALSAQKIAAAWAILATELWPNVILEFSDGTFGTLDGAFPLSAVGTFEYNSGSTPDEYAMEFQVPWACKVDGFWALVWIEGTTSNFDVILYDGTSAMSNGSVSVDANSVMSNAGTRIIAQPFAGEVTLAANTTYRLAFKPTSANNIRIDYFDVSAAGHLACHAYGQYGTTNRTDAGSWAAPTATRRLQAGLRFSSFDDGASSGGITVPTACIGAESVFLGA